MHLLWMCRMEQAIVETSVAHFRASLSHTSYHIQSDTLRPVALLAGLFDGCTKHPKN